MRLQILFLVVVLAITVECGNSGEDGESGKDMYYNVGKNDWKDKDDGKNDWKDKDDTDEDTHDSWKKKKLGWSDSKVYDSDEDEKHDGKGKYDDSNDNDDYHSKGKNKKHGGKNKYDDDDDDKSDDDYKPSENRSKRRPRHPDERGHINLYFREPSNDGKRKKCQRLRFPVNRFKPGRLPRFPPLINFLPTLPIFADPLTKQTIIFSPLGGIYIIPPVINFYGQRFSIAQLIASGYCSLVSSGAPPPPAVNVAPLVQPGPVSGPAIPPVDYKTGGFKGGVQTQLRSFPTPRYPPTMEQEGRYENRASGSGGGYGY